ncbi:MAG: hypothetical protein V1773_06680 [bacterium]
MIEIFEAIYYKYCLWIFEFLRFLIDLVDNILPQSVKGFGFLIVYGGYIIVLFTMGFLTLKFIIKKKYLASASFFIIFLFMSIILMIAFGNIANKGFE